MGKTLQFSTVFGRLHKDVQQNSATYESGIDLEESGAPGEIRTPDPLVRSQILYPTELRAHMMAEREGFEPSMSFWPILP